MAVEAKVEGENIRRPEYPYLGKAETGQVILFTSETSGFNVNGVVSPIGSHSYSWNEAVFTPLSTSESVTLRNV